MVQPLHKICLRARKPMDFFDTIVLVYDDKTVWRRKEYPFYLIIVLLVYYDDIKFHLCVSCLILQQYCWDLQAKPHMHTRPNDTIKMATNRSLLTKPGSQQDQPERTPHGRLAPNLHSKSLNPKRNKIGVSKRNHGFGNVTHITLLIFVKPNLKAE